MIDLHCHSTFSDGSFSPEELIEKAQKNQIKCLSLTDHDTVSAYPRLHQAAQNTGIQIVQGIEFSTRWKKYDIHILGYQLNLSDELTETIERQSASRIARAQQIGASLETMGVERAYEKACALAGHERVGRPHFAAVLLQEGRVRDMQAAFRQFLGRGRGAYVPTPWISLREAVAAIAKAGGQAVVAHPLKYGLTRTKLHELIIEFKDAGGAGIEVVSGEMTVSQISDVAALCLRFDLLASSGSDYHGDSSRTYLGRQQQLPAFCTPIWHDWTIEQGTL